MTHDIGVRMALGARQGELQLILNKKVVLICAGIVIGVLASLGLTRFLAGQLWGHFRKRRRRPARAPDGPSYPSRLIRSQKNRCDDRNLCPTRRQLFSWRWPLFLHCIKRMLSKNEFTSLRIAVLDLSPPSLYHLVPCMSCATSQNS
jgi:ABC-type antimicrobial peptide transport system permease subunit